MAFSQMLLDSIGVYVTEHTDVLRIMNYKRMLT